MLSRTVREGSNPIREVDDGEWPAEPDQEDSGDLSALPDWLQYLLLLDDLLEQGLTDISRRRVQAGRRKIPRLFPPAQLYIETIPTRELDDPPDDEIDAVSYSGIIEELSRTQISD